MGIERWVPVHDEATQHSIDIAAPREAVWSALHQSDFAESWLVRVLFLARGISRRRVDMSAFVDREFTVLEEDPPSLLVLGMVGRPHRSQVDRATRDSFSEYDTPGSVRIGWEFAIAPLGDGSVVTTTTRIVATDDAGRRRFRRYWRVIKPFSGMTRIGMLRLIRRRAEDAVRL